MVRVCLAMRLDLGKHSVWAFNVLQVKICETPVFVIVMFRTYIS